MSILNAKHCPICGAELKNEVFCNEHNDALIVECVACGKYAMSREFYEDHVEQAPKDTSREKLTVFLKKHKSDKLRPFFSQYRVAVPDGFTNYPHEICILGTNLGK